MVAIGALVVVVLLLVFATGLLDERGWSKPLCDNSLCITPPAGWHAETYFGGISSQLVLAPFPLSDGEGSPPTPAGKFQLVIFNYDRGYRFGWNRRAIVSIAERDIKQTHELDSPASAYRKVVFRGHSLEVLVYFGDAEPSSDQIESVNRILSTIRRRPPPKPTQ